MKKLVLILALVLPLSAIADTEKYKNQLCDGIYELSHLSMTHRQNGDDISDVLDIPEVHNWQVAIASVMDAYAYPIQAEMDKKAFIHEYATVRYLRCIEYIEDRIKGS